MKAVLLEMAKSKKFLVALLGVVVSILNAVFEIGLDAESLALTLSPFLVYIASQGVADHGKSAAIENADLQLKVMGKKT